MSDLSLNKDGASPAPLPPSDQKYFPAPDEAQLSLRAVAVGCLIGSVVSCTNIYIGLKIGWTFGASIIAAVLGFAVFRLAGKSISVLETNIAQTAGSAAGSMASAAGLVAAIPAMNLLGYEISWYGMVFWSLSVAFLGVFFAVPLRRQVVEVDKLRFPTGTATAETILAMFSDAGEALKKAKVLIYAGIAAGIFTLANHFIPAIGMPPGTGLMIYLGVTALIVSMACLVIGKTHAATLAGVWAACFLLLDTVVPAAALATAATWTFRVYMGPALFGAGFLIGPRVSFSLLLGAILAWAILGPMAVSKGWTTDQVMAYKGGVRGWLLWPGVALMVSEALAALGLSWRTFLNALTMTRSATGGEGESGIAAEERIPNSWWIGGLAVGTTLAAIVGYMVFEIAPWMTVVAVAMSSVLAIVAVRSVGETDINPVGGMGKVTQLVYGGLAPGQMSTNLMAAAVTGAGASQAGDMMQDLKTGYLLGASPRKQFLAQLAGICAGVVFVVPAYLLFTGAYEIGGTDLPAPAAFAWKAMAELLANGFDALPPFAVEAVIVASIVGVATALLRKVDAIKAYVPSGLAMGIAFIIPAFYSLVMVAGTLVWLVWRSRSPESVRKYDFVLASGLVAGEGLMGLVNAVLTILEIGPIGG